MNDLAEQHLKQISAIREEMRFEIGVFHDRINALISAEAFLLISFTMALSYAASGPRNGMFWISPTLSAIGFSLAALAWPGVLTSYRIIVEWNVLFVNVLNVAHAASTIEWRPSVFRDDAKRIHADHRQGMLFLRLMPMIFMIAWVVLACLVLVSHRR